MLHEAQSGAEGQAPGGDAHDWLVFLAQLPAAPSSARVALWRRLRAAGAAGLLNGAWALPLTEAHAALLAQLAETVHGQGGTAVLLAARAANPAEREAVLGRFRDDRAREYGEFAERARGFLAEVAKETGLGKFSFAELEEIEDDLDKLTAWLGKIGARDFYPDRRAREAAATLEHCREALRGFAEAVYANEGVSAPPGGENGSPEPPP